ncbi:hypothetical protein QFW77_13185 [Luteimonas sp. RD2P54]|uniref:Lipoprotein n=1 Tax=Luteimonas endophytica TaxID=3042023 RepID=A0ABT6JAS6_9GAMM|nr:hypothetical protein [Luteimonas endophytica]MDH5823932.1 hypothetical protein [Luteimonas endophytica]
MKRQDSRMGAFRAAAGLALALLATACQPAQEGATLPTSPPVVTAPAPAEVQQPDPSRASGRAAPPMLQPVALGSFESGSAIADSVTGNVEIEGAVIRGENGAEFVTERVAIVRGGDEYRPGERYADALMIGAEHPVELRRVVAEKSPTISPGNAFCREFRTGFLAIARITGGEEDVVKVMGLRGSDMPAPSAEDIAVCTSTQYFARR